MADGVPEFYAGRDLLVTGATGFMGKVLVEKLLRSCPGLAGIYLLLRPKQGKDVQGRVKEMLQSPVRAMNAIAEEEKKIWLVFEQATAILLSTYSTAVLLAGGATAWSRRTPSGGRQRGRVTAGARAESRGPRYAAGQGVHRLPRRGDGAFR